MNHHSHSHHFGSTRRRRRSNRPLLERLEERLQPSRLSLLGTVLGDLQPTNAPSAAVSTPASSLIARGPQVQVAGVMRQINLAGTTSFSTTVMGVPANSSGPELAPTIGIGDTSGGGAIASGAPNGSQVSGAAVAKSNPELVTSFDGLNHYQQRFANNGNQFSIEPPDQGLAVGNGYVLEVVNDVLRVYDTSGNPLNGVQDLNTFFGYPAAFNRTPGVSDPFGPSMTDPSAYYDTDTQRWFVDVLTLDTVPATGAFTGKAHLDIAVSQTSSPLGKWNIYKLPVQDNGTDGTPNHGIGAAFGDYPHIGADKYGFYITTNEYAFSSFSGPEAEVYHAAQIYALSKNALASGASSVAVTQFDTIGMVQSSRGTQPGFTVWPAISPGASTPTTKGH